ncbi:pilus assembly protein [Novosphingobium sp.]|uniref:TadE/TadG family type IV pilus assembly protein n=1 Tax=Novosphingobium sp. TaxID=1874826 RepID=UPI00286C5F05|nr:pilus assembly protein [Novosphingobium sp.]
MLRRLTTLPRSDRASTTVEFAILAPVIFSLMLGVLQLGLHMHNYNAVRSVATDTARWVIVEYQKGNTLTDEQIESKATAYAVNAPYLLEADNLTTTTSRPTTDVTGTIKMLVQVSYVPRNVLNFIGVSSPTLSVTRPIYVDQ